jgi:uncharacterized protein (DUF433 family)
MTPKPDNAALAPSIEHIQATPDTCGGKPRIAGTHVRVQDIVIWHERLRHSVDEIVSRHSHLSLAGVYAALAYYHDHRDQIDGDMQTGEQLVEEIRRQYHSNLAAKLNAGQRARSAFISMRASPRQSSLRRATNTRS